MSEEAIFDQPAPPQAVLPRILSMAQEAINLERQIEQLELALNEKKSNLGHLKNKLLPDAMSEAGLSEFKTPEGAKVSIGDFVSGSLPKDPQKRSEAISWLSSVGAGDLIKTSVDLQFGRKEHNQAISVAESLREQGLSPKVETGVHPQTLAAFARERIRNGEEVPFDVLGLYAGRVAKIQWDQP